MAQWLRAALTKNQYLISSTHMVAHSSNYRGSDIFWPFWWSTFTHVLIPSHRVVTLSLKIYLLCIHCSVCMYVCKSEKGTSCHYRWVETTMWLLGIEFRTSGRAGRALNF